MRRGKLAVGAVVAIGAVLYVAALALNDYSGITRASTRARHKLQAAQYTWYGEYVGLPAARVARVGKWANEGD